MEHSLASTVHHDFSGIAIWLTVALGGLKLIEVLIDYLSSRLKLRAEQARAQGETKPHINTPDDVIGSLREIVHKIHDVHAIVSVKDPDGTPMVYSSRSSNDIIRQIANSLERSTEVQERTVKFLERLEEKLERGFDEIRSMRDS